MFTVSVEVKPASPPKEETEPSLPTSDAILVAVVLAFVMMFVCAFVMIYRRWRRRRRPILDYGACSCLKYNIVEVAN
jgi:hypothetical protein